MKKFKMPSRKSYLDTIRSSALPLKQKLAVLKGARDSSEHPYSFEQQRAQVQRVLKNSTKGTGSLTRGSRKGGKF